MISIIHPRLHTLGGASKLIVETAIELTSRGFLIQLICGKCHPYWRETIRHVGRSDGKIFLNELGVRFESPISWLMVIQLSQKLSRMIDTSAKAVIASGFPAWIASSISRHHNRVMISFLQDAPPVLHDYDAWNKLPFSLCIFYKFMNRFYGEIDKRSVATSDIIITNSYLSAKLNSMVYDLNYKKISVIYPGINVRELIIANPSPKKAARKKIDIIFIPNGASPWRRPDTVLKAVGKLKNVLAIFTGASTEDLRKVINLARKIGVRDKVVCLPFLLGSKLRYMYSIASVVVTLAYRESFGLTALEALALGKPVIITKNSGAAEVLLHGVHTLHADPNDYDGLAIKIEKLLTDIQFAEKIVRNGRLKVLREFTIQKFVNSLLKEINIIS
jgi:glycosyltransferase involved in cell wall biosynthesis